MARLRRKKEFKEDLHDSDESTGKVNFEKAKHSPTQFKSMQKQIRLLQHEMKTLKRLSILSIFGGKAGLKHFYKDIWYCLLYTSPSPRDLATSSMPSSA